MIVASPSPGPLTSSFVFCGRFRLGMVGVLLLAVSAAAPAVATAQQVGDNVNVLPVYKTVKCSTDQATGKVNCAWQDDGYDYLRGNLYGQRLNEPAILVSSRNKDHIILFFNDYRAVDVQADQPIPETTRSVFVAMWNGVKSIFAKLAGRPAKMGQPGEAHGAAFSQAALGCSVSYDGGLTWTGCMVPGMPFDTTPASVVSPSYVRGLQGMSDPAVAAGKCGKGYLAGIAFTANEGSQMQVHTLQDMNDSDVQHTWDWKKIAAVSDCNNASWGCFVDKPAITVGPPLVAPASCGGVTETVYTTYTTFTGTTGTGSTKFQSKVNLAISTNGGQSFSSQLVDGNYTQVQGTDVEVSPVATTSDPAGTVFVFFRSFGSPNSIIMRRSAPKGSGWDKPVDVLALGDPSRPTLQAFDQPTIDLATAGGPNGLTFRSNAFPAAAMTPDGRLLILTFQEKANASGLPDPAGTPRIMMTYSANGGRTWSPRRAISYQGNRAELPGLGFFAPGGSAPGPQVQPAIACSTSSSCLVTWMESKEALSTNGWMSGYNRRMNHRALALQIQNGVPVANPAGSVQVSRYSYADDTKPTADADGDVEKKTAADGTAYPMWNNFNINNYSTGTSPFAGDYTDVRPLTPNTFITAFTDNRFIMPATSGPGGGTQPWLNYPTYGPWPQCANPGSRAQTVMAAQISNGLVVTTPTNFKSFTSSTPVACGATFDPATGTWSAPTRACVEFPFTAWNNTDSDKRYKIWLSGATASLPGGSVNASFAKDYSLDGTYAYPLRDGGLNIYQFSSNSANVYVFDGSPVTVNIAECPSTGCTGFTPTSIDASITFNGAAAAPSSLATSSFSYTPSAVVVSGRNVSGRNVSGRNVSGRNVSGRNVSGRNTLPGDVTVYNTIDYSVDVTPSSDDDVGTYLSLFNVDEAYASDYIFQVLVTKPLTSFTTVGCEPFNVTDGALVGQTAGQTVSGRNVSGRNVSGRNVSGRNPVPVDGDVTAQVIQNTSFTMGSSTADFLPTGNGTGSQTTFGCPGGFGRIGECTQAAPRLPNTVTITLRAYQITANPTRVYNPEVAPPAIAVAEYACKTESCIAASGPDLAVPDPPAPPATSVAPTDVRAGAAVTFPTADVTVTNLGKDCANGDACGTAQPHRWGIYLSTAASAADLQRYAAGDSCPYPEDPTRCVPGMIKENLTDFTKKVTTRLATGSFPELAAGGTEIVTPQGVQIPGGIPRLNADGTGTYYLYLYIDDQRVVSELDEDNNIVQGGPVIVRAPSFGFLGLQTPCTGMTCDKTGTMPLAWQFTNGSLPVDSASSLPRLKFWNGCPASPVDALGYPTGLPAASSAPNAADITSGASGWQYFPNPGMSRPQYTWQFNFDATKLPRGVCYTMWLEIPSTGQVVGAIDPLFRPFGPFSITPR